MGQVRALEGLVCQCPAGQGRRAGSSGHSSVPNIPTRLKIGA